MWIIWLRSYITICCTGGHQLDTSAECRGYVTPPAIGQSYVVQVCWCICKAFIGYPSDNFVCVTCNGAPIAGWCCDITSNKGAANCGGSFGTIQINAGAHLEFNTCSTALCGVVKPSYASIWIANVGSTTGSYIRTNPVYVASTTDSYVGPQPNYPQVIGFEELI